MEANNPMPMKSSNNEEEVHGMLMILSIITLVILVLMGVYLWYQGEQQKIVANNVAKTFNVLDTKLNVLNGRFDEMKQMQEDAMMMKEDAMMEEKMMEEAMMMEHDELHFVHPLYGFSLDFPESWRGYRVDYQTLEGQENLSTVIFGFEDEPNLFQITVETIDHRESYLEDTDGFAGAEIGRDNQFVYLIGGALGFSDEYSSQMDQVDQILATFQPKQ